MRCFRQTIVDLSADAQSVRRRGHGLLEVVAGKFSRLELRPWPRVFALGDNIHLALGDKFHWAWNWKTPRRPSGDACWLYYNQPRRFPNFLALKYVVSTRDCSLATIFQAARLLDEIARIKQSDAILADATNLRISDRLLARWGWRPHKPSRWHRNYIKRFYGQYPPSTLDPPATLRLYQPELAESTAQ